MFLIHCHRRNICHAQYNKFSIIFCLYTESNLKFYIERLSHKVHKQFCVEGRKRVSTPPQLS